MRKAFINGSILFVFIVTIFFMVNRKSESFLVSRISKDSITVEGEVTDIKYIHRHGYRVYYKYVYNGAEHHNSNLRGEYSDVKNFLRGRILPVVISKSSPDTSYMLILPDEYEMFGRNANYWNQN